MALAIRFRLAIDLDVAREAAPRLRLDKRIPGGDDLPPPPRSGLWIDVVDGTGEVVYSKILDRVPDGTREAFGRDGNLQRVPDPQPFREYVVFVPVVPDGRLVVNGSSPTDPTARPIGVFPL